MYGEKFYVSWGNVFSYIEVYSKVLMYFFKNMKDMTDFKTFLFKIQLILKSIPFLSLFKMTFSNKHYSYIIISRNILDIS